MKITICGSMHHIQAMTSAARLLENLGYDIEIPNPREGQTDYATLPSSERAKLKTSLIQEHLDKINESDAIFVYNEDKRGVAGYIGGNTLMEMAFAYAQGIEIFVLKAVPDMGYTDEILGMQPIILDADVRAIDAYFNQLPVVYVSSKSPVKLAAISRGMRRAGIRTRVVAQPTQSNITEQPSSIDETYAGALNRHEALKSAIEPTQPVYLATVESGHHRAHSDHNSFGTTVVVLEKAGGERKIGINLDLEFPKGMTDMVPSKYPDLGVLVQQEYGSSLKDPFPFFTGGKINRRMLIEHAVYQVAVQLSE
jgi:non-canonical (house-cleaning) NTP pyrophosphatase